MSTPRAEQEEESSTPQTPEEENGLFGDDMSRTGSAYAIIPPSTDTFTSPDMSVRSLISSPSSSNIDLAASLPTEHSRYLELQRIAFTIKLLCVIGFLFCIYSYVIRAWWLLFSFGWLFNPIGFCGALYFKRTFILAFMVGLVVDAIFQVAYMFVTLNTYGGPGVILSLFFIFVQGYFLYYVYQFYKQLPQDGMRSFQRFLDVQPISPIPLQRVEE